MTVKEFRSRRLAAGIPAIAVAARAKKNRSWLSGVECGHFQPTAEELELLRVTLEQLIRAKTVIQQAAIAAGWPGAEIAR
jgi:transcriptional regulator with XRE-family HTH domain